MKSLKQSAQDYIRMRRLLGFKMRHEERRLRRFVSFMELQKATYITTKLALTWAMEPADAQPATWAERLMCVRVFARYCSGASTHGGSSVRHLTVPGATSHALPL